MKAKDLKIDKNLMPDYVFIKNEEGVTVLKYTVTEFMSFMETVSHFRKNFGPFESIEEAIDHANKYFGEEMYAELVLRKDL